MSFPAGKYDDQVDVMSLFGMMLAEMMKGHVPEKPEKVRWPQDLTFDELVEHNRKQRLQDE